MNSTRPNIAASDIILKQLSVRLNVPVAGLRKLAIISGTPRVVEMFDPAAAPVPGLIRELDQQPSNSRDWDHEGNTNSLAIQCAMDRRRTGCAGHDYFEYDSGHFLIWRDWSNVELPIPSPPVTAAARMETEVLL